MINHTRIFSSLVSRKVPLYYLRWGHQSVVMVLEGVCAILLWLYTSTECLKRVYTSPGQLLEIDYFTKVMFLIIIYNFYVYSFYLKLT